MQVDSAGLETSEVAFGVDRIWTRTVLLLISPQERRSAQYSNDPGTCMQKFSFALSIHLSISNEWSHKTWSIINYRHAASWLQAVDIARAL